MEPQDEAREPVIISGEEFTSRVAEEMKRSDRYEHPFTIVVFRPPAGALSEDELTTEGWFRSLAAGLVRGCDVVSVFEAQGIVAVLLPETGVAGGNALLDRLRGALGDSTHDWNYKLLEYPHNRDTISELTKRAA